MARIEVTTRIQCDRCKCYLPEDSHHARLLLFVGFGDLREGKGRLVTAPDLCDACSRKVRKFIENPDEGYQEKFEI